MDEIDLLTVEHPGLWRELSRQAVAVAAKSGVFLKPTEEKENWKSVASAEELQEYLGLA